MRQCAALSACDYPGTTLHSSRTAWVPKCSREPGCNAKAQPSTGTSWEAVAKLAHQQPLFGLNRMPLQRVWPSCFLPQRTQVGGNFCPGKGSPALVCHLATVAEVVSLGSGVPLHSLPLWAEGTVPVELSAAPKGSQSLAPP